MNYLLSDVKLINKLSRCKERSTRKLYVLGHEVQVRIRFVSERSEIEQNSVTHSLFYIGVDYFGSRKTIHWCS